MKYTVISQPSSWIEGAALEQLSNTSGLAHMRQIVGMPDLHPGKGSAVGAAFLTENNHIYPHLIGSDIGCGMLVAELDVESHRLNQSKIAKRLEKLESVGDPEIGSVGGGNHFVEIQKVVESRDYKNKTFVTIHTGSRGLGAYILSEYSKKNGAAPVDVQSELGQWYLSEHEAAIVWARKNRAALLDKVREVLAVDAKPLLDIYHNYLEEYAPGQWLHRKGAASSNNPLAIIPGSRGDHSYIVKPLKSDINLDSIAHGAGRKWQRSSCKCKLEGKFTAEQLKKTKMGSVVICDDKDLLYEEAPEAYKKVSSVVDDLLHFKLIEVEAILAPVVTYKTSQK